MLSEAHHNSKETSLSAAWASILKAQFHYYNGHAHLALRELIRANFCFGVYIGNYNFSFKYKRQQSSTGGNGWEDWNKTKIELIKYYIANEESFNGKIDAATKIEKTGLFKDKRSGENSNLTFDQIDLILKGNVYNKLKRLEK